MRDTIMIKALLQARTGRSFSPWPISYSRSYASSNDIPPELLAKLRIIPIKTTKTIKQKPLEQPTRSKSPAEQEYKANNRIGKDKVQASLSSTRQHTIACHEIDKFGVLHTLGGKFLKTSLCSSLGILARDLRKLDGTLKDQIPLILVRESAILVNIEHLRAIVKFDGVILFEDFDPIQRAKQQEFLINLKNRLARDHEIKNKSPFEFVVLEMMLQRIFQTLQEEFSLMKPEVDEHLRELENIVHWERLKVLLVCRKRVAAFLERVNNIRSCIKELLESDDDMADMYLSEKQMAKLHDRSTYDHEEVELLLENYLKMAEELTSRTQMLLSNMQATEDIVNIALVGQRNELVLLDLRIGIGTFAASMGALAAGVFGMNLQSGLEHSPFAFYVVLGTLLSVASTSFALVWRRMLKLVHRK